MLGVRARGGDTSGSPWHKRGWGPRSRPGAGVFGTHRLQLHARKRRREPSQAGGEHSPNSGSRTAASGGNQGAGAPSRAQHRLRARGAHAAGLRPPPGSGPLSRLTWSVPEPPPEWADTARFAGEISKDREEPGLLPTSPPSQDTLGPTRPAFPPARPGGHRSQLYFRRLYLCVKEA